MKKIKSIALILIVSLLLSAIPVYVLAADNKIILPKSGCYTIGNYTYLIPMPDNKAREFKFGVLGYSEGSVKWSLSNTSNATIDSSGKLTFKGALEGNQNITVTASTLSGTEIDSLQVYLTADYSIEITSPSDAILKIPEDGFGKLTVRCTVMPTISKMVNWSLADKSIAEITTTLTSKPYYVDILAKRPGKVTLSADFIPDSRYNGNFEFNITGVKVESSNGIDERMVISSAQSNPTKQLTAYLESSAYVDSWTSSNTFVATVNSNGLVTAKNPGMTIITATDSKGQKGSYKINVVKENVPYFDKFELGTTSLSGWKTGQTFSPAVTTYNIEMNSYSSSTVTVAGATTFNTDKYGAKATYINSEGDFVELPVNSSKSTALENIPFDTNTLKITLYDKNDNTNKTEYDFIITRPRDKNKSLKANGIVFEPYGRSTLSSLYNNYAEGTMFKADENGNLTSGTGVAAAHYYYKVFALDNLEQFTLKFSGITNYTHIRYSIDNGKKWSSYSKGSSVTMPISFEENANVKIIIEVLDDYTFAKNIKNGQDGFYGNEAVSYTVFAELADADILSAQILSATVSKGDWYPDFSPKIATYTIGVPYGNSSVTLTFNTSAGATVNVGSKLQTPNASGFYTISLTSANKKVTVTSSDGKVSAAYNFKIKQHSSLAYADKIVDYLCVNSQYTNGTYSDPLTTLTGGLASLGNFGGYITYYFNEPLTDDPKNKYGMDFYAYGNSMITTGTTSSQGFAEPGQVWVSEDGIKWYALAGSEHYEDNVLWDYTVKYSKSDLGLTNWEDNKGNSKINSFDTGNWVNSGFYYLNQLAKQKTFTLKGICLPGADGTILGLTNPIATEASFGYVDYFPNGTIGADVNPYDKSSVNKNGFDLAWAVDENGKSVDVSSKKFHYVKIVTADNIWAGSFKDKSCETAGVLRTTPQTSSVGKTATPIIKINGKTVSGTNPLIVDKDFTVTVTADSDTNVFINNSRTRALTFSEIPNHKTIRVIAQKGDCEASVTTVSIVESGDVNCDGTVNIIDLISLKKMLAQKTDSTPYGDVDNSGKVDALDLTDLIIKLIK